MSVKNLEKSAFKAIQILRKKKLQQGQPFMINSDLLDSTQCLLEYPNGSFKIVEADSDSCDFKIIMDAPPVMIKQIKKQLNSL
jgi:hypothetical protein